VGRVCGVCVWCERCVLVCVCVCVCLFVCVFEVLRGTVGWREIEYELGYAVFSVLYFELLCCIGQ
jgi:hypothetical protein